MARQRFSSPVPVGSRVGSNFGRRGSSWHLGDDYPPPKPGQQGVTVHAIADGKVTALGTGVLRGHSGRIIVIDHGVIPGVGRVQSNAGHLAAYRTKLGAVVDAGEVIGVMGYSGNVIPAGPGGTHLHQGIRLDGAWVDPSVFLARFGITIGKTAPLTPAVVVPPKPAQPGSSAEARLIQDRLRAMGYRSTASTGRMDAATKRQVAAYQRAQRFPVGGLYADGVWGPKTEAHYVWVRLLQATLNNWKGADIRVDGDYRSVTKERVRYTQGRNGLYRDGLAGAKTCRLLGIRVHP